MPKVPLSTEEVLSLIDLAIDAGNTNVIKGIVSDVMESAHAQYARYQEELSKGIELQREANHPSPCQKFCESTAFRTEIRQLKRIIDDQAEVIKELKSK